jgi:hypothetical protein
MQTRQRPEDMVSDVHIDPGHVGGTASGNDFRADALILYAHRRAP